MASGEPAFRFCPACGGQLEPRQLKAGDPLRPVCARCGYVHYLDPADSDFCGLRSGCEAARRSGFSYFGSPYISLPLFSMLAQIALLSLSLRRGRDRAQRLGTGGAAALWALPELTLFAAAGLGGALAVALIAYQGLVLGAFCWLCMVTDGSVIGAALCALGWASAVRDQEQLPLSPLRPGAWFGCAAR